MARAPQPMRLDAGNVMVPLRGGEDGTDADAAAPPPKETVTEAVFRERYNLDAPDPGGIMRQQPVFQMEDQMGHPMYADYMYGGPEMGYGGWPGGPEGWGAEAWGPWNNGWGNYAEMGWAQAGWPPQGPPPGGKGGLMAGIHPEAPYMA